MPFPCPPPLSLFPAHSCHTNAGTSGAANSDLDGGYVTVDLGISTAIGSIVVVNRQDACCTTRLNGFGLFVGDDPSYKNNAMCDPSIVPFDLSLITAAMAAAQGLTIQYAARINCALTGRYLTLKAALGNYMNLAELQAYAYNSCPPRTATGAAIVVGSVCSNAGWGSVCTFTCNAGYVAVSGSTSAVCNGAVWSEPPLVCMPTCDDLPAPPNTAYGVQTFYSQDFTLDGALANLQSLRPTVDLMGFPASSPPQGSKFFQYDGMLQTSANVLVSEDLYAVISNEKIANYQSQFSLTAAVYTYTRAGLAWRAQDANNL